MKTALESYHVDLKDVKKSKAWFETQIKAMEKARVTPRNLMTKDGGMKLTSNLVPTRMYAFYYMPMTRDKLPYYDTFPLIFPLSRTQDNFHGLNMHYLDYPARFALFRVLLKIASTPNITDASRMKISWGQIQGLAGTALAQACIKQYRFDHVRSPFLEIKPTDWATAMMLPCHRFVGAPTISIWQQSSTLNRTW
jgi:hypothetical protein